VPAHEISGHAAIRSKTRAGGATANVDRSLDNAGADTEKDCSRNGSTEVPINKTILSYIKSLLQVEPLCWQSSVLTPGELRARWSGGGLTLTLWTAGLGRRSSGTADRERPVPRFTLRHLPYCVILKEFTSVGFALTRPSCISTRCGGSSSCRRHQWGAA
jgi:hypothetical protein